MLRVVLTLALLPCAALAGTIEFTEELRIDPTGTEAEFGELGDVEVAADGTLFVADPGFGQIHVFGPDGAHLRSFGSTGDGPGDLPDQFIEIAIGADGNLLVAGMRSNVGRLDGEGELIGSIPLELFPMRVPGGLFEMADGTLGMVFTRTDVRVDPVPPPTLLHLYAADGSALRSFAESSWWTDEHAIQWAGTLLYGRALCSPGSQEVVFLQCQPFELRRYRIDGTEIGRTTEGLAAFVDPPDPPEVKGDTTTFRFRGGSAWTLVQGRDEEVLVLASRRHPEDEVDELLADPEFTPRREYVICVYGPDLALRATASGEDLPVLVAGDGQGRVWARKQNDEGLTYLIRYHYTLAD